MRKHHEALMRIRADANVPKFNDAPIRRVLREAMPKMSLSKIGRLRLVGALSHKYGDNFRNFEDAASALKHFDDEHTLLRTYLITKGHVRG